jgi:hypothetical protein
VLLSLLLLLLVLRRVLLRFLLLVGAASMRLQHLQLRDWQRLRLYWINKSCCCNCCCCAACREVYEAVCCCSAQLHEALSSSAKQLVAVGSAEE